MLQSRNNINVVTGDYLFNPKASNTYSRSEDHIAFIHELIGPPDLKWLKKAKKFRKYYTTNGRMKKITKHKIWKLENILREKYWFKALEAKKFADFLMMALQWKNEDRASAQEMLKHEWFTMPADYDCRLDTQDSEVEKEENNDISDSEYSDDWETLGTVSDSEGSDFELLEYP